MKYFLIILSLLAYMSTNAQDHSELFRLYKERDIYVAKLRGDIPGNPKEQSNVDKMLLRWDKKAEAIEKVLGRKRQKPSTTATKQWNNFWLNEIRMIDIEIEYETNLKPK